jgi:hypothetical protein
MLDLQTLDERREDLAVVFAQKCLANPKMKHLFPPNDKIHTMGLRQHAPFHVFKANTKRMQQSPIIYMQKLLNTEARSKLDNDKLWNN